MTDQETKCSGYVDRTCIHGHLDHHQATPACYGDPLLKHFDNSSRPYKTMPKTWVPPCVREDEDND